VANFIASVGYSGWHTATLTWMLTAITLQLDGWNVGTTTSRIPDTPMQLVIQTKTTAASVVIRSGSAAGSIRLGQMKADTPAEIRVHAPLPARHAT
jgi:hypothetical protein